MICKVEDFSYFNSHLTSHFIDFRAFYLTGNFIDFRAFSVVY